MSTPIASLPTINNENKGNESRPNTVATPFIMHPVENRNLIRFCCSGISCMSAGFVTNPIDVIKVRLQLDNQLSGKKSIFADRYYPGFLRGVIVIAKDEGICGLYKGVAASMLRESIYSTFRLGAYEPVKGVLGASGPHTPLWKKILAGAITGSVGSAIANPTDLVKIRMQSQGKLKAGEQPRYLNTFDAFSSIVKRGGMIALWHGVGPTVQRAALVSASQIPAYDHTKNSIKQKGIMKEGLRLHFVASLIAGLVTALITSPIDVIKTRTMDERYLCTKQCPVYSSTVASFRKILRAEGLLGFYKGFIPNWMRTGPHTMITFLVFEQLRKVSGLEPV